MSRREETSLEERSSAIKRPAAEGEGGEEEPKKKLSFGINKPQEKSSLAMPVSAKKPLSGISIKLGQAQQQKATPQTGVSALKPKVGSAASVFGDEEDDDDEEMPPEAKMRMKNIGRDTPTSAGPNSFGKTRMGFCDSKKIYEKQLKEVQDKANRVEDAL